MKRTSGNELKFETVRKLALALPDVVEAPHFDRTSFRVANKIFATAPHTGETLNIFLDEPEREQALALNGRFIESLWWGKKVCGLMITLSSADKATVEHLLKQAWKRRAPKRVASVSGI